MKLPGWQQSTNDRKGGGQLSLPQIKSSIQSLSESQSPSLMPHWLDDEQHEMTSSAMTLQSLAEISNHILYICTFD